MLKAVITLIGFGLGIAIASFLFSPQRISFAADESDNTQTVPSIQHHVIGFLPYWLLSKADKNYAQYINSLAYFALTVEGDGSIQKYTNPGEAEPGWYTLKSGKADTVLQKAKQDGLTLSLVLFSGNEESIGQLISNPDEHARTLMKEVLPIMKKYDFTDLNIDVESVQIASEEARMNFTRFVKEVSNHLQTEQGLSLSIDASPTAFIKQYLVDPVSIEPLVDQFIIMGYDYHYQGSSVTGPVAPLGGSGTLSEFDTDVGIRLAKQVVPAEKLILAIPLYGYEWESLDPINRAATIPGSGITASNRRVEELISTCDDCTISREPEGQEAYVIFSDKETDTYHQIFYPDKQATEAKISFARKEQLGGIALWALGYEGDTILEPLKSYK